MPTRTIFNTATQQDEEAELRIDRNGEIVATFKDGFFVKFPQHTTKTTYKKDAEATEKKSPITPEDLEVMIADHKDANLGQEVITPEMEAQAAADQAAALQAIGVDPDDPEAVAAATAEPKPDNQSNGNTMPEDNKTHEPQTSEDPET